MPRRRRSRKFSRDPIEVEIESLSHEGRGITRINGKTVFVFGALVGETVIIEIVKSSRKFDEAKVLEVIKPSPDRIEPRCAAYQQCGGCSLQHIDNSTQIQLKQQSLLDMLTHAGISWGTLLPPLESQSWGYRGKARLGVKFVEKKGRVLVGFRERNSPYVCDMHRCEVLIPEVGENLDSLSEMIGKLDARALIPQIEVAADGDQIQLVFRHLKPLSEQDQQRLIEFGRRFNFMIQLQSGGPDTVVDLYPQNQVLQLRPLQDVDLKIEFRATDFVQVNRELNQKMIRQALNLLSLNENDRVLDLFCGLGNFTLPMARLCQQVVGVEGDLAMVERAGQGALRNQL
ncbi:MAG: 23S rRNA (uracil(1939)-C(5))-methyltransferase RlmD, partial [Pseudomonadota bacterium]